MNKKKVVKNAVANERLEKLKVSLESKKIAEKYASGEVSAREAARKIRARYGVL
ncbi:MAG: antitoxin VbhA family protein [Candidatus Nomurabacteria bacterium]|jgi:hypothetical protein|nr:antitoxin VbhA family protein [Candidatus Nomurabacteria bacterium]